MTLKTNVQLSRLALGAVGNNGLPVVVVESIEGRVVNNGITRRVVVELDEKLVKGGVLDQVLHGKVLRVGRALGGSSHNQRRVKSTENLNHLDVRCHCCVETKS